MARQIALDTETTGFGPDHRIIEICCIEISPAGGQTSALFHHYVDPGRSIDLRATAVHGITSDLLRGKPRFAEIAPALVEFICGSELIIHNAAFDVGILDAELQLAGCMERIADLCRVIDTARLAREMHPGEKCSLDALCERYGIDNSRRGRHGAHLDARLLADVYAAMTKVGVSHEVRPNRRHRSTKRRRWSKARRERLWREIREGRQL